MNQTTTLLRSQLKRRQESSNRSLDFHALHDAVQIYVPSITIGASRKPAYMASCLLHEFAVRTQGGLEDLNNYPATAQRWMA